MNNRDVLYLPFSGSSLTQCVALVNEITFVVWYLVKYPSGLGYIDWLRHLSMGLSVEEKSWKTKRGYAK